MRLRTSVGIKANLNKLAENTKCNDAFLAKLIAKTIISIEEKQRLDAILKTTGDIAASKHFYELLIHKSVEEKQFRECLQETCQTGALAIFDSFNKPVWFDVQPPVSTFVGRAEELQKLTEQKTCSKNITNQNITVISQIKSVVGIGGIGKTELCRKYLSLQLPSNAVWLNADNEGTISTSFKRLARILEVPVFSNDGEERDIITIVQDIFKELENTYTIFVYDNCDNPELLHDQRFLPKVRPGITPPKIFITSRNSGWPGVKTILIDKLKLEEAIKLVSTQLDEHSLCHCHTIQNCEELVKKLQLFPLAIQQAIAYIIQENISSVSAYTVDHYIADFERKTFSLLNSTAFQNIDCDYSKTTYTTWRITTDCLFQSGKLSVDDLHLLQLFAYLDPETIQFDLFDGFREDALKQKAFQCFRSYSLLSQNEETNTFGIHRLFQKVIRLELKDKNMEASTIEDVLELVNRNEAISSTIHSTAAWRFASKHPGIVKKFYSQSLYTNKQLTPLHLLSQDGHTAGVTALANLLTPLGPKMLDFLNKTDEYNRTALFIASALGHNEIIKVLIKSGAETNVKSNICYSTFDQLNINTLDPTQWNPLHIAAYYNRLEAVNLLMSFDEDMIEERDLRHQTPPLIAVLVGNVEAVEIMKPHDCLYKTCALMAGVVKGDVEYADLENSLENIEANKNELLNQLLVQHNSWKGYDFTPIRIAAHVKAPVKIVKLLERHGAKLFRFNGEYRQLLTYCGANNNGQLAKHILDQVKNPDLQITNNAWTILHAAAKYGGLSVIQSIVDNFEVNVNIKDRHWDTPLYQAAYHGQLETVKYLVEKGADVNIVNKIGCTAIIAAAINYKQEVVKYLLSLEECKMFPWKTSEDKESLLGRLQISLLHVLVAYDEVDMLKYVMELKQLERDIFGEKSYDKNRSLVISLLHAGALFNSTKTIKYLVDKSHPCVFDYQLDVLYCLLSFYYAARNGLFEIQYKKVFDWVVWFAERLPREMFCLNPSQLSTLIGIDSDSPLQEITSAHSPSVLLRTIFAMIPQTREMIKLFREYLSVQKDPNLQAGKELTKLVHMFRRQA